MASSLYVLVHGTLEWESERERERERDHELRRVVEGWPRASIENMARILCNIPSCVEIHCFILAGLLCGSLLSRRHSVSELMDVRKGIFVNRAQMDVLCRAMKECKTAKSTGSSC